LAASRQPSSNELLLYSAQSAASRQSAAYPEPLISGGLFSLNEPLAINSISGQSGGLEIFECKSRWFFESKSALLAPFTAETIRLPEYLQASIATTAWWVVRELSPE